MKRLGLWFVLSMVGSGTLYGCVNGALFKLRGGFKQPLQLGWRPSQSLMLSSTWMSILPVAAETMAEQWEVSPTGHAISRIDSQGTLRTFEFGCDAISVLRNWFEGASQHHALHKCGRVKNSLHRREEGLAVGLDLPKPPAECQCCVVTSCLARMGPQSCSRHRRHRVA